MQRSSEQPRNDPPTPQPAQDPLSAATASTAASAAGWPREGRSSRRRPCCAWLWRRVIQETSAQPWQLARIPTPSSSPWPAGRRSNTARCATTCAARRCCWQRAPTLRRGPAAQLPCTGLLAPCTGSLGVIAVLLQRTPELALRWDADGLSPLDAAMDGGRYRAARLLLAHGAQPPVGEVLAALDPPRRPRRGARRQTWHPSGSHRQPWA